MVQIVLVASLIFAIAGVVLIIIATIITGAISTTKDPGDIKNRLRASSGLSGLSAFLAIIAAILGLLYGGAALAASIAPIRSLKRKVRRRLIAFIIVTIIVLILFAAVIGLNLTLRANPGLDDAQKKSMTASIILAGVGILCVSISAIILFVFARSKLPKGFTKVKKLTKLTK